MITIVRCLLCVVVNHPTRPTPTPHPTNHSTKLTPFPLLPPPTQTQTHTHNQQEYARRAAHHLHPLTEPHFLAHPFGQCLAAAVVPGVTLTGACGEGNPGVVGEVWELLARLPYRLRYALYK